jgi:hypothetical protein
MRHAAFIAVLGLGIWACGGSGSGDDDDTIDAALLDDGGLPIDAGPAGGMDAHPGGSGDGLDTATGCAGQLNPNQVLDLHIEMSAGDWSTVQGDLTFSIVVPAMISCGGEPAKMVAVRRKRSGGTVKVGLKIDVNHYVDPQDFHGLTKLSLENGVSSGSTENGSVRDLMAEYLAWRLMARSGAITGRAAFAQVFVNGDSLGAYVNVEDVNKRFLRDRVGDDDGWLFKKSGGDGDGYHTNETVANPYEGYFCFWGGGGGSCAPPGDVAVTLPQHLDVEQYLRVGAVNALMGNHDSPLLKDNNYLFYDWAGGGRLYFPWDLDTVMGDDYDVFTGTVPGGTSMYTDVLFSAWEDEYDAILTELLAGPLSLDAIHDELERAVSVAGDVLDGDPFTGGGAAGAASDLGGWWDQRHPTVTAQVDEH